MNDRICLCPVCERHSIPKRCNAFRNTCKPEPPAPDCSCALRGIHAQLTGENDIIISQSENIVFNEIVESHGDLIEYNKATGAFRLEKKAAYLVNWNVAVEGCDLRPFVRFALKVDGQIHSAAAMPVTIGMLSGSALVMAKKHASLALVNDTGDKVRLQAVQPMANITIMSL